MNKPKTVRPNISNPEVAQKWEKLADEIGGNASDVMATLIAAYEFQNEEVKTVTSPTITPEIQEALEIAGEDFDTFLQKAIKARVGYVKNAFGQRESSPGTAKNRIQKGIDAVKEWNDNCREKQEKYYITKALIFNLTGCNRVTIRKYFDQKNVKADLEEHHERHGIVSDSINRKPQGTVEGYLKPKVEHLLG